MATATKTKPTPIKTKRTVKAAVIPTKDPEPTLARPLADLLADALLFAGTDWTLPVLATVRLDVTAGKLRAVTTDRYCIGVRTMKYDGPEFAFLLNVDDAQDLVRLLRSRRSPSAKKEGPEVTLTVKGGTFPALAVKVGNLSVVYTQNSDLGNFPKFEPLVELIKTKPTTGDVGTFACNPRYLARFAKLSAVKSTFQPLKVITSGATNGVQITAGPDFWGALMPVRLTENPDEVAA